MNKWYSVTELAKMQLPGFPGSIRGIDKLAKRQNWPSRPRQGRGGGLEYHISSLPLPAQESLLRAESKEIIAQTSALVAQSVQPLVSDLNIARKAQGDARAALITGRGQQKMEAKREILALVEKIKQTGGNVETAVADYNAKRLEVSAETRAVFQSISIPTVHRWIKQANGYGLARLAGSYGNRAGSGIIDTYPQLAAALRAFILEFPHAHAKHAHEWLTARYALDWSALPAEIAGDGPIPMPGLSTTRRWIERWKKENQELYIRLSNPDEWKSRYMIGWGDMSAHVLRPNQVWEFDSTPADVLLNDGRHSIIGVIDLYTRRVKLHVSKTSRSAAVAHVIKRALMAWGVPEIAKTDNGADYVSKHVSRIFQALGIEHQVAAPFCPWQKPHIERFFRTFSHDLVELLPGYIGHNVADREALRARQQFSDRLFVKDAVVELPGLTAAELQTFCDRWTTGYHNRAHSGLKGKTPQERIDAWTQPIRTLPDPRVLDLLLLEAPGGDGWRTITKAYGVRVDTFEYMAADLGCYVGERIRVLYDPEDAARVYCFDDRGAYLATAECPELTGTPRQALAAAAKAVQLKNIGDKKREAKREAKKIPVRDALEVLLAQREAAAPTVFPPTDVEPYSTKAIEGAIAALTPPPAPELPAVSEETMARLREEMRPADPAGADSEPDHASAFACVRWRYEQILQGKKKMEDVPQEWKEYVQWYYRDAQDRGRFLEASLKDFYPKFPQVRAFLLGISEEEDADTAETGG